MARKFNFFRSFGIIYLEPLNQCFNNQLNLPWRENLMHSDHHKSYTRIRSSYRENIKPEQQLHKIQNVNHKQYIRYKQKKYQGAFALSSTVQVELCSDESRRKYHTLDPVGLTLQLLCDYVSLSLQVWSTPCA